MRVVGGAARGHRLRAPRGASVRPTTDRVREAAFDILASLDVIEAARVLDLFAGTGAMAIEALSRGAESATLVERDPAALACIAANLEATGLGSRAQVHRADALCWLERHVDEHADVAFCDPPYDFKGWDRLLERLRGPRDRPRTALAVLESLRPVEPTHGWEVLRVRRYGSSVVTLVMPSSTDRKGAT